MSATTVLCRAWTEQFDRWFAAPRTIVMRPELNTPFYFAVEGVPDPHHYGRFLHLQRDRLVEMTSVTGASRRRTCQLTVARGRSGDGR